MWLGRNEQAGVDSAAHSAPISPGSLELSIGDIGLGRVPDSFWFAHASA